MNLQSAEQAPSSRADAAVTPVTLDLSKTKITNFAPNAFAFNSETPISTLNLSTCAAIAADGIANNAFTFPTTAGSTVTVTGGKDVTAAQMQTLASMLPTGTNLGVNESSVSWKTNESGSSEFDQFVQNSSNIKVEVSQLKLDATSLASTDLTKYSTITDLQLKTTFASFTDAAFADTKVNTITFGSKAEGSTAADEVTATDDSGTKKSATLKTIINLFAKDDSSKAGASETDVLTGWQNVQLDGAEAQNHRYKEIKGITWYFDPNTNTISCDNAAVDYVCTKDGNNIFTNFKSDGKPITQIKIYIDTTVAEAITGKTANLQINANTINANNLSNYTSIENLQLLTTFESFDKDTFF